MTAATSAFGAYLLQPIGSDLLIGCGNSPGNEAGCQIFRSADGATFAHEFAPSEQGANVDGQLIGGEWWVCGQDPSPDDWTLGNLYQRSAAGVWSKIRTLPNVIHALGLWNDGSSIWVAVGADADEAWSGRVLRSDDGGATWPAQVEINQYRAYDVIGFDSKLYAIGYDWTGSTYTRDLHMSADAGATWSKVAGVTPAIKPRLVLHGGDIIGVQSSMAGVFRVSAGGGVTLHSTPFTIANYWNVLESDGTYLYALSDTGAVWRSLDLMTWAVYTLVNSAISIRWWPGHGLMIGDIGTAARVWVA